MGCAEAEGLMTEVIIAVATAGVEPFRCASRSELLTDLQQRRFKDWIGNAGQTSPDARRPILLCGHCTAADTGRPLRVIIAKREGIFFPRAWQNEQRLHAADCSTVGNGAHSSASPGRPLSDLKTLFHRSFDAVYARGLEGSAFSPTDFVREFDRLLREGGPDRWKLRGGVNFRTGLVENSEETLPIFPDGSRTLDTSVACPAIRYWSIPKSIELAVRTTPHGFTLPGAHIISGAWHPSGELLHLQAWPVYVARKMHPYHSMLEREFLELLERTGADYVKPPSINFMKDHATGAFADLLRVVSANDIWPDVVVKAGDRVCAIEISDDIGAEYLVRRARKTLMYSRLEAEYGLQWAMLLPVGDSLRIDRGSAELELRKLLPSLVNHDSAHA